ncbi:MAG: ATP-binding cassette domain-containing protein [Rhodospirillaceae bacterium]
MAATLLRPAHLRPGQPLILDAGALWQIEAGAVDVFTAVDGVRRFLFSAGPGGVLCGAAPGRDGRVLVAVPWDGATVARLDGAALRTRIAAVDAWIAGLLDGAARGLLPHPAADRRLRPGEQAAVRPAEVLSARRGVAWLAAAEPPLMLGLDSPPGLVPVTPMSWATATSAGTVECLDTATVLHRPDGLAQVAAVTECVVAVLSLKDSLGRADDLIRLRERDRRDREAFARAGLGPAPAEPGDPLLGVVRRLAEPLGMTVRRPAKVRAVDADKPLTLEEIARVSDFRARQVRLPDGWWRRDLGALIVRRTDGVPLAVIGRDLIDAEGTVTPLTAATAGDLGGLGHVLHRTLPPRRLRWPEVLSFDLGRGLGDVLVLALTLGMGALCGMAVPLALGTAYGTVEGEGLVLLGGVLLCVALAAGMFAAVGELARLRLDARLRDSMGSALWDRVLRLPLWALRRPAAGVLAARAECPAALQAAWRAFAILAVGQGGLAAGALAVLALVHPPSVAAGVVVLICYLGVAGVSGVVQARVLRAGDAAAGKAQGILFQILSGLSKVRLAAAEDRAFLVWYEHFKASRQPRLKARRIAALHQAVLAAVPLPVVAWLLIGLSGTGIETVVAVLTAFAGLLAAAARLALGVQDVALAWPLADAGRPLLETPPESVAGRVDAGRLSGEIEVTRLTFGYERDAPPILDGVSFRAEPGEFIGIVGRSGSGKSTLMRLLIGLENPDGGAIFYDGFDLRGLDLSVVRAQVGTVLQGGRVMPGSLLDIVRGDSGADLETVRAAVEAAGLSADIAAMPMGLHTLVTDGSRTLSGGQVQRLLLARALVAKPPIFLLDEATSALDTRTQASVMAHLAEASATRLVIAHRLSTVAEADRILVLEGGRIVESGPYADLVARGGVFARMVAAGAEEPNVVGRDISR